MAIAGAGVGVAEPRGLLVVVEEHRAADLGSGATSTSTPSTIPKVLRRPGSRPNPTLPEGTDTMPKIEHIVVVMMENHSFDARFGMLGRGDGFKLDGNGNCRSTRTR